MASNDISQEYARRIHAETQKQKQILHGGAGPDDAIAAVANVHVQHAQALLNAIERLEARINDLESRVP